MTIFIIVYIFHRYINNEIKYIISLLFIVILMETKNSKLGRPKGSKNRISLTEMDDVESDINEQSKQIVKRFSASIEKLQEFINSQLSNIEMEFNDAILDLRKDVMQLKQEINILKQTNDVLEGNVDSVEEIINKQNEKINDLERHSRKNNLPIIGVPYTKDKDCFKVSKTILNSVLNTDVSMDIAYRTGRYVPNKSKQIIAKLSSIEDKHNITKNLKRMLIWQTCYIVDDLTQKDLKEKRKWLPII